MRAQLDSFLRQRGVDCWGVCRFADLPPLLPCRASARLPEGSASVAVVLLPYRAGDYPRCNVARHAIPDDYHALAMELLRPVCAEMAALYPQERWEPFVDDSPIPEVKAAWLAGLGAIGRHGQLIHPRYGAYVCIAEIVTTAALPPSTPVEESCPGCGRCVTACPTGALSPGSGLDRSRCRAAITQKKSALSDWEAGQIREGKLVWGCDICLDACPLHETAAYSALPAVLRRGDPILTEENLDELLQIKSYNYRGKSVLLRNLRLIRQAAGSPGN